MPHYMLIMRGISELVEALSTQQRDDIVAGHGRFTEAMKRTGEFVSTHALADTDDSTVVSVSDGDTAVRRGPFHPSEVSMGGYYIVDCEDRDRAHAVAAMIPDARLDGVGIEVRPIVYSDAAN